MITRTATLNGSAAGRVEHGVAPPMAAAVTLPVLIDGRDVGVAVYVARSPFAEPSPENSDGALRQIAAGLVARTK